MTNPTHYLICYDIADDRRRNRVANLLEGFGRRVQYSVFEAVLDRRLFDKLLSQLQALLDPADDSLTIYPVCAACVPRRIAMGLSAADWVQEPVVFVV